jgi:hypothetical protein
VNIGGAVCASCDQINYLKLKAFFWARRRDSGKFLRRLGQIGPIQRPMMWWKKNGKKVGPADAAAQIHTNITHHLTAVAPCQGHRPTIESRLA